MKAPARGWRIRGSVALGLVATTLIVCASAVTPARAAGGWSTPRLVFEATGRLSGQDLVVDAYGRAHAVWVAQHRLQDAARAQRYAHTLSAASDPAIPAWAQQMEIFVLEGTGEVARARVLLTKLLASGTVRDAHEYAFLSKRLAQMLPAEKPVGESPEVLK